MNLPLWKLTVSFMITTILQFIIKIHFAAGLFDEWKKYKANLLAVEANETIIVDQEQVIKYADDNNIVIMAV